MSARLKERIWLTAILCLFGAGWGITQPLSKIVVSQGYRHFGLIFWQMVIIAVILGVVLAIRRRGLPLGRRQVFFYVLIALTGTLLPNTASYEAVRHLPSGVMSVSIAAVPMFAFPIALMLGLDRMSMLRVLGLMCGIGGVALLAGPTGLPDPGMLAWLPVALIAPLLYGIEGNVVAKWGTGGAGPTQLLCGASIVGALMALPLAVMTGTWIDPRPPWGAPDYAFMASSLIHAFVYVGYVWLVGRAGPVFAGQVAYLVTGFGVVWAMLILGERYSGYFWAALGLMLIGLFLVQPRDNAGLADAGQPGEDKAADNMDPTQ
ncbi:DMT family transporter [Alisedimentitalea sp. MJ-SS2]|uniref:DMT family transporter n=1 Tax=Aliisedimentitalea sp. MJ-SS2 TaxID=3049795 RepID=UPI002913B6C4|nr:DMT family transporter [Alisedimentitalea sp. MJ-SS2]MDU8927376.1 DMT family transporter [Alisedimentitalea sp. MJ-SS2]